MTFNLDLDQGLSADAGGAPQHDPSLPTLVTLLLDRSGSMQSIKEDTIGAVNSYVSDLSREDADIRVSLVLFDHYASGPGNNGMQLEKLCVAKPARTFQPLGPSDYRPRGQTPLIDAACATIRAIEQSLEGRRANVVLAIQTDGKENASTENKWADLRSLVSEKEAEGWQFIFMGAGIDAYSESAQMGISPEKTLSYGKDARGTRESFAAMAANTRAYASSGDAESMLSTDEQKSRSGDLYWAGGR